MEAGIAAKRYDKTAAHAGVRAANSEKRKVVTKAGDSVKIRCESKEKLVFELDLNRTRFFRAQSKLRPAQRNCQNPIVQDKRRTSCQRRAACMTDDSRRCAFARLLVSARKECCTQPDSPIVLDWVARLLHATLGVRLRVSLTEIMLPDHAILYTVTGFNLPLECSQPNIRAMLCGRDAEYPTSQTNRS